MIAKIALDTDPEEFETKARDNFNKIMEENKDMVDAINRKAMKRDARRLRRRKKKSVNVEVKQNEKTSTK